MSVDGDNKTTGSGSSGKKSKAPPPPPPPKHPVGSNSRLLLLVEFQEAFMLFDKDNDGIISKEDLRKLLRCLGRVPTDENFEDIVADADPELTGEIELKSFLAAMCGRLEGRHVY